MGLGFVFTECVCLFATGGVLVVSLLCSACLWIDCCVFIFRFRWTL